MMTSCALDWLLFFIFLSESSKLVPRFAVKNPGTDLDEMMK
jgi:hypothetical protein